MLLHGFPEFWYSWRHQLSALSSSGYAVAAPDMRGYGGTDSPSSSPGDRSAYGIRTLALDVVSAASALGYEEFAIVGHDFGSYLAWHVSLLHPERVWAVAGLSVPWAGRSPKDCGQLTALSRKYGNSLPGRQGGAPHASREERLRARFHYMLHHCLPGAAEEYGKNTGEALYRMYAYHPGVECEVGTPEVTDLRMFPPPQPPISPSGSGSNSGGEGVMRIGGNAATPAFPSPPRLPEELDARCAPGFWSRLPRPASLPLWLSREDLNRYVAEFERTGFSGGLSWYGALDANWEATSDLRGRRVTMPALFAAGDEDGVIRANGGPGRVREGLEENCEDLRGCAFLGGGGHWIQQERPEEVNAMLLSFLESARPAAAKDGVQEGTWRRSLL